MPRCLIIGCGCRGQQLTRGLIQQGHVVRGTTRALAARAAIEAAGAEPVVADPDRVATIVSALDHVSVVCILLGSAGGSPAQLEALHGSRLQMLLTRLVDTTVQGVVYETRGSVDNALLGSGAELVRAFAARTHAEWAALDADPRDHEHWLASAIRRVAEVLGPR
ncbi:MAG TPA: hypothetical protein VGY32_08255 [Solirubrobacteraceae bacterium]|nr:hypothetical protein [Solirubrobacteraceae bacterium]